MGGGGGGVESFHTDNYLGPEVPQSSAYTLSDEITSTGTVGKYSLPLSPGRENLYEYIIAVDTHQFPSLLL